MLHSSSQRFSHAARDFLPTLLTLICVVLGAVNWSIPDLGPVTPPLALMAVYYWTWYRPDLFRPLHVFCIGLLADALSGLPPGLLTLFFLVTWRLTLRLRLVLASESFFTLWLGYSIMAFLVFCLQWASLSLVHGQMLAIGAAFMQMALGLFLFPLFANLMLAIQRRYLVLRR